MRRHPIHDHADAGAVAGIHKRLKVCRCAIAAGGREIAGYLIAPAAVERILHQRQQLYMRIAHLCKVRHQLPGQLAIAVRVAVGISAPAASMHLVDVHGLVQRALRSGALLPRGVCPFVAALQLVHFAAVCRARFGVECIRVGLKHQLVGRRCNAVFIDVILLQAGNKAFPDPSFGIEVFHRSGRGHPAVKIPHHGDSLCARRPDMEHHALGLAHRCKMRAEKALAFIVIPLLE